MRRQIGNGGMGVVYEVLDRQRHEVVALKALRHADARTLLRFKNEFRALADLQHENLVRLGELFADGDRWFFTMELVRGQGFLAWVREEPREARLRSALVQLARGLAALHDAGKVHRDVKPSNVLVTPEGRVVLLDFGLVIEADAPGADSETNVVGTAAYMAPEQAASRRVGPEADWYAVGSMLYEALTGQPPFVGAPLAVLIEKQKREPPPPRTLVAGVPPDLDRLCIDLLRADPGARLSGAEAVARLTEAGGAASAAVRPAPAPVAPAAPSAATPFVGRAAELAELRGAWAAAREVESRAVTVLITGESGIGKSALARQFLAELGEREPEALVLAARCYEREAVPFKAFDGVVDALSRHLARVDQVEAALYLPADAGSLARVFPVLRRAPAVARVPDARVGSPQELRTRAFQALRELLTRLAERRPLVVFIDDFQWADDDSLALVEHLMHGAAAPPLLLLLTGRTGTRLPPITSETRTVPLTGLDGESARGLVALLAEGARVDDDAIAAEAHGHPLFLAELVRHAAAGGPAGPVRLDDALTARVDALEPRARTLLEILAVAGEPLAPEVAAEAARLGLAEAHARVPLLRAAHLVRAPAGGETDRLECYHDRVREAVSARLDPTTLRRHHLALAAAIEAAGAGGGAGAGTSPLALVRHLEAAGETERAAEHAERAAVRAAESLAFDRAADLYRTALRLGRHTSEAQRRLRMALGDTLINAGRGAAAAAVYQEAADGADPATRLHCLRLAAQHLLGTGNTEEGLKAVAAVLAELGEELPATPRKALVRLAWNRLRLRLRGLGFKRRDASELPGRALLRVDTYNAVGLGIGMIDNIRGADFQTRALLAALDTGERTRMVTALGLDASFRSSQGVRARRHALRLVALMKQLTADADDKYLTNWAVTAEGIVCYLGGDFGAACRLLGESEVVFRDELAGHPWELTTIRVFTMLALRQAGRYRELMRRYDSQVPELARRGDRYGEATLTRVGCIVWLAADEARTVDAALARCAWHPPPGGYHMQNWYEWRARVDAALYQGTPAALPATVAETVAALKKSFLWRVQTIRAEAAWAGARLALAAGAPDAPAVAERAARALRREKVGYATAWAELLAAAAAWRRGDTPAAKSALVQAIELARAAEVAGCAAAAELVLAHVEGGEAGAARADRARAAFAAEGVIRPERFTDMLVPGFGLAAVGSR